MIGAVRRQGMHQVAPKSTSVRPLNCATSLSKLRSSTITASGDASGAVALEALRAVSSTASPADFFSFGSGAGVDGMITAGAAGAILEGAGPAEDVLSSSVSATTVFGTVGIT